MIPLMLVLALLAPYGGGSALYGHTDPKAAHCYRKTQVAHRGTDMVITATRKARVCNGKRTAWDSGFVGTRENRKWLPLFGRIEVRATLPKRAPGIWPALWLRHANGASTAEVDLVEVFNHSLPRSDAASQTLHFPRTAGTHVWSKGIRRLPAGAHTWWVDIRPRGRGATFTMGVDTWTTGRYFLRDATLLKRTSLRKGWDVAANIAVSSGRWTGDHRRARDNTYRMTVHSIAWKATP